MHAAKCKAKARSDLALALEAVRRIDALFEIERNIIGEMPKRLRAARQKLSAPLVADLETWCMYGLARHPLAEFQRQEG